MGEACDDRRGLSAEFTGDKLSLSRVYLNAFEWREWRDWLKRALTEVPWVKALSRGESWNRMTSLSPCWRWFCCTP